MLPMSALPDNGTGSRPLIELSNQILGTLLTSLGLDVLLWSLWTTPLADVPASAPARSYLVDRNVTFAFGLAAGLNIALAEQIVVMHGSLLMTEGGLLVGLASGLMIGFGCGSPGVTARSA